MDIPTNSTAPSLGEDEFLATRDETSVLCDRLKEVGNTDRWSVVAMLADDEDEGQ